MADPGEGFYPYLAQIVAYGNGGFRFAGMSHRGSLLCLRSGMRAWDATSPGDVTLERLKLVLDSADNIDVLLIGLGGDVAAIDPAIRPAMRERKIIVEAISTGSAVRTYNVLFNEQRAVAAALIAVDNVR